MAVYRFLTKHVQRYGSMNQKFGWNSVLNFRRVTHFRLCLLETQGQKRVVFLPTLFVVNTIRSLLQCSSWSAVVCVQVCIGPVYGMVHMLLSQPGEGVYFWIRAWGHDMTYHDMTCNSISCHAMSWHVVSCEGLAQTGDGIFFWAW